MGKTGDVCRVDEKGDFYITDRIKELIKYKGFQVAPAELEGLLNTHASILDAAVIGVYAEDIASELPKAFVVLKPGINETSQLARDIQEFVKERVAYYKQLRGGVTFVDHIPK